MFEMLSAADPPLLYAVVGVVIFAVASLFGLVLFASREETFEDVVEKQRKAQEALLHSLQQGSSAKGSSAKSGKQNRKWNKLKNKKASKGKGQDEPEIDSGVDDDELNTECVTINAPPPTITAEEPPPAPAPSKKKKKGKKNKNQQQDAVVEKHVEEKIEPVVEAEDVIEECIEEEIIVETPAVDVEAAPDVPSDDEVDDDASNEESEDVPVSEDAVPEEEEEEDEVVEEEVVEDVVENVEEVAVEDAVEDVVEDVEPEVVAETEIVEPVVPAPKVEPVVEKSKKKKNKSSNKQKGEVKGAVITNTVEKLQVDIKNCDLNVDEVQQLMDALLEKQSELEQWQKPNQKSDPVEQLKRRIAEVEMQFAEERQSAQAMAGKNKELKLELVQEKNHRQGIQSEATNRLNQQAKEAEAIRKRMEEKHTAEMHSAQSQIKRMQGIIDEGATNHMELQRMIEENAHLKNASMMAQQLAEDKQSLMGELSQVQQTNKALRQEFDNLIIHHQQEMQNIQIAKVDSEGALSQRLQEMNDQLMKGEAHNRSLQLEITEHQRLSEQQRLTEMESLQMAAKPDGQQELDELNSKLAEIQEKLDASELSVKHFKEQSEAKSKELEETCANLTKLEDQLAESEKKLAAAESESGKEVEPVNDEVATLVARLEKENQLVLALKQKVSELEHQGSSGQHSPDLVVVNPSDLLGSAPPLLTSESFEEVVADEDYEDQTDLRQEIVEEIASEAVIVESESGPGDVVEPDVSVVDISLDECVDGSLDDKTEQLVGGIVEVTSVDKLKADFNAAEEKLAEAQCSLSKKDEAIAGHMADIAEKICIIKEHESAVASKQAEIDLLQSKILAQEEPLEKEGGAEEKLAEAQHLLSEKDAAVASKQAEIDLLQSKILAYETSVDSKPPEICDTDGATAEYMAKVLELEESLVAKDTEINKIIAEKDELVNELKEKAEKLEEAISKDAPEKPTEDGMSYNELVEKLNTVKEELRGRVDATDELKMKNNELREKNWKVIDALAKAEKLNADNAKSIEIRIMKGLKSIFPGIKIPTNPDNDIDLLFKEFGELVAEQTKTKSEELESELKDVQCKATKLEEVNKCLQEEIDELKKTNELMPPDQDEMLIKKQQENGQLLEENAHLKNALIDTESKLSCVQTGVDEKESELELTRKSSEEMKLVLSKHGYEHENLTMLESSLSDGQKQLMAEKEENSRIKLELKETEKNLVETQKLLAHEKEHSQKLREVQENNTTAVTSEAEVTELSTKLKKTISERDLLIREYKHMKDHSTKMEAELSETKHSLLSKTESSQKLSDEIEKLKAKITLTETSANTVHDATDKDKLIEKLTTEIEELKEELREERDCVIVDIDPDNSENLQQQVEVLSTELESEKQCKASLASKLEDMEKSYKEDDVISDKVTHLEGKLKLAEQKILELEAEKKLSSKSMQSDGAESRSGTSV